MSHGSAQVLRAAKAVRWGHAAVISVITLLGTWAKLQKLRLRRRRKTAFRTLPGADGTLPDTPSALWQKNHRASDNSAFRTRPHHASSSKRINWELHGLSK